MTNDQIIKLLTDALNGNADAKIATAKKRIILDFDHAIRTGLVLADGISRETGDWMIDALRDTLNTIAEDRRVER